MSEPYTPSALLDHLAELGIQTTTLDHPPVFTVEQAKQHREGLSGVFTKNLFVRNKKGKMWLVVLPEDCAVDMKELGRRLGAGRLSFGSPERLMRTLGVIPGAVTPFGLINDTDHEVQPVFDQQVLAGPVVHAHPLDNAKTTAIAPQDLLLFVRACGHEPQVLDLRQTPD
jgi:Ala-tRNA(Pro) deacylase